jgi:hypothetical protein
VEDILVRIRNSFVPVDFVILKMDVYHQIPLILRWPFLSTIGTTIVVAARIIKLNIIRKRRHSHSNPRVSKSATKSWS